jgi:hypothetical protein
MADLAAFHEFKLFRTTEEGDADLWAAQCWCDWLSDIYLTRTEAKSAYVRHQTEWLRKLAKSA